MSHQLEEPDITPLINVNLVILVMALLMTSHAARLLPLALPKAQGAKIFVAHKALPAAAVVPRKDRRVIRC